MEWRNVRGKEGKRPTQDRSKEGRKPRKDGERGVVEKRDLEEGGKNGHKLDAQKCNTKTTQRDRQKEA